MSVRLTRVARVARCPYSELAYFAEPFFGEHLSSSPLGRFTAAVSVRRQPLSHLTRNLALREALAIRWSPTRPLLPTWYALLTILPHFEGARLEMQLFHGPSKGLGGLFASIVDRVAARRAAARLLDALAEQLAEQWFTSRHSFDRVGASMVVHRYRN